MIDLHFVATPNGHKVSIMLLETGLEHRIIRYNMLAGDHQTAEFRAISPNGRAPAIVDHDPIGGGAPYPMFETGAILIYLAEKSGMLLPKEPRARYRAHQWLMWHVRPRSDARPGPPLRPLCARRAALRGQPLHDRGPALARRDERPLGRG
jgi:GST-like protein